MEKTVQIAATTPSPVAAEFRVLAEAAGFTLFGRHLAILSDVLDGGTHDEVARAHGVGLSIVKEVLSRFRKHGIDGLRERTSTPVPITAGDSRDAVTLATVVHATNASQVCTLPSSSPDSAHRRAAEMTMAEGSPQSKVARRYGVRQSTVNRWTRKLRGRAMLRSAKVPDGQVATADGFGLSDGPGGTAKRRKGFHVDLLRGLLEGYSPDYLRWLAAHQMDPTRNRDLRFVAEVAAGASFAEAAKRIGGYPLKNGFQRTAELVELLTSLGPEDMPRVANESQRPPFVSEQAKALAERASASPHPSVRRRLKAAAAIVDAKLRRQLATQELGDAEDPLAVARKYRVSLRRLRAWLGELSAKVQQAA